MTRNLDVFCPETCTLAPNHEQNNHRPLTIRSRSRLSSTVFVNSGGMLAASLLPKLHWHKGIPSRLVGQRISIFPVFDEKRRKFPLIRLVNLPLSNTVIGSGSHASIRHITVAQHSGQLCNIQVKMCLSFRSFTKYLRKAPCYDFYAISLMKKRNLFPAYQKPFVCRD